MFENILVPLDGSRLAEKILPQVEKLAQLNKSAVTLMTVGSYNEIFEGTPGMIESVLEQARQTGEAYLEKIAAALKGKGLEVNSVYAEGMPAHEIIAYAAHNNIDLIAMATHGRGEVAWVLGSVAEKVVSHATVPVLLFRVIKTKPPLTKEEFKEEALR